MKVRIEAAGRTVEAECTEDQMTLTELGGQVLGLWTAAGATGEGASLGPAYGFQAERRGAQASPMNLGGYGGGYISEPRVEH